jgi:hypothetical protein
MPEKYFIGPSFKERIQQTIRVVESMAQPASIVRLPTSVETLPQPQQNVFRIATFTGAWSISATKVVTFKYQTTTPNTVSAINLACGLNPTGSCDVSVAKDGTAWYLVQPNLTQQPGYSGSGTQVLTIQNGSLAWVGTTAC